MCFMNILKSITRIAWKKDPEPGEQGERGAIPRMRKFVVGVEYQCGASGEEFLDYAYYDGVWYRCRDTHTPTGDQNPFDDIGHGYDTWSAESGFDFLSTKCMIVGDDGEGWIMEKGTFTHTSGKVKFNSDGSANFNDKCVITADGDIHAQSGIFEGYLRTNFVHLSESDAVYGNHITINGYQSVYRSGYKPNTDLNLITEGATIILPSTPEYVGAIITICANNYPPSTKAPSVPTTVYSGQKAAFRRPDAYETLEEAEDAFTNGYTEEYVVSWVAGIKRFLGLPYVYNGIVQGVRWVIYNY